MESELGVSNMHVGWRTLKSIQGKHLEFLNGDVGRRRLLVKVEAGGVFFVDE